MSDVEEPPTKMSKYEEYLEDNEECLEEGQEEWLSEGVLTDDDYHVSAMAEEEKPDLKVEIKTQDSQDTMLMQDMVMDTVNQNNGMENTDQNIEDTLDNLDSKNSLSEELGTFLIRNTEDNSEQQEMKEEVTKVNEEDDGNDTDDLLRLLEDDQQVKKKAMKIIKKEKTEDQGSSDDDEFIYERSKVKTLKLAKNALIKRVPSKAVPEHSDTDDESSSDGAVVKRVFGLRNAPSKTMDKNNETPRKVVKHVVQVNSNYYKSKPTKTIVKQPPKVKTEFKPNQMEVKTTPFKVEKNVIKTEIKTEVNGEENKEELDEIIDEEEFLEEDDFELDEEEFGEGSEGEMSKQRIMKPEMMDEEVPTDDESHSEDGSLYDELPSSDSEDFDDWFTLDIRGERAADYLPLLGSSARALLSGERGRCVGRVRTLRRALSALTDSARRQADTLRRAAMALAELDDTLRAA